MKNIHLIPTDKPSRLHLDINNYLSYDLGIYSKENKSFGSYINIYITSDERPTSDEYYIIDDIYEVLKNDFLKFIDNNCKKIILTTDLELIKDGVQEINDEFLEWFVKNPTCEFIDWDYKSNEFIQKEIGTLGHDEGLLQSEYDKYVKEYGAYEIIIPSVEQTKCYCGHTTYCDCSPLTETFKKTLEEAAKIATRIYVNEREKQTAFLEFINGAKWQEQRMYSEEEVLEIIRQYALEEHLITSSKPEIWFEKIKKT